MLGRNIGTGTNILVPIGLTWPNLAKISPNLAPWWSYSNRGLYIRFRGSMEYFMWAISGSDLGQISPIIWTPPFKACSKSFCHFKFHFISELDAANISNQIKLSYYFRLGHLWAVHKYLHFPLMR